MTTRRLLVAADDAAKLGQRIGKSDRKDGDRARVTGVRVLTRGNQHEPVPATCEAHDWCLSPFSKRPQHAVCPSGCRPSCGAWRVWRARHPHLGHPLPLRLSPPLATSSLCGPSLSTQPGFQSSLEGDFYYNVSGFRMGAHESTLGWLAIERHGRCQGRPLRWRWKRRVAQLAPMASTRQGSPFGRSRGRNRKRPRVRLVLNAANKRLSSRQTDGASPSVRFKKTYRPGVATFDVMQPGPVHLHP